MAKFLCRSVDESVLITAHLVELNLLEAQLDEVLQPRRMAVRAVAIDSETRTPTTSLLHPAFAMLLRNPGAFSGLRTRGTLPDQSRCDPSLKLEPRFGGVLLCQESLS